VDSRRARVPLGGASNESGVVDVGNFWRFRWLFLRKLVKVRFRPALLDSECLTIENNCVKSNIHRPTLLAAEM